MFSPNNFSQVTSLSITKYSTMSSGNNTESMSSMLSQLLDKISLPFPLLHCEGCVCEEDDCSTTSILFRLYTVLYYMVSLLAGSSAMWLIPLLVMTWSYRWVVIHYLRALIYNRGVIPIIREDRLRNKSGRLVVARAVRILDHALSSPNVTLVLLVLDGSMLTFQDICSCHELAVYLKNISRNKSIRVVSFLRERVSTASYVLALAADTIMVDFTTRLEMEVSQGVRGILEESGRKVKEGSLEMVGREVVSAGLADGVGNYMDFLVNKMGAVVVPVEGPGGSEIFGFCTNH